jgi:hypothetical protein
MVIKLLNSLQQKIIMHYLRVCVLDSDTFTFSLGGVVQDKSQMLKPMLKNSKNKEELSHDFHGFH